MSIHNIDIHYNRSTPFVVQLQTGSNNARIINENLQFTDITFTEVFTGDEHELQCPPYEGIGGTILFHIHGLHYIFIEADTWEFNSISPIINFVSNIGNNDVPYPYAIDSENRYYLLIERVILLNVPEKKDPYDYYYSNNIISVQSVRRNNSVFPDPHNGRIINSLFELHDKRKIININEIRGTNKSKNKKYLFLDNEYQVTYAPFPQNRYHEPGTTRYLKYIDSDNLVKITEKYLQKINNAVALVRGFIPLEMSIYPAIWVQSSR